jgi:hypothetical protein
LTFACNRRTGAGAQRYSTAADYQIEIFSGTQSGTELLKTGWQKRG